LKTNSGKTYTTKISEQDKNLKAIAPKSSKTITYYSIVDNAANLTDFKFDIVMWDFSVPSYERRLGSIQYPTGLNEKTPIYKDKLMQYGNTSLSSKIAHYTFTEDSNSTYLQINYQIENK